MLDFFIHRRATHRFAKPGSIKLFGDEFPVPAKQRVWLGRSRHIGQGLPPQTFGNFSQRGLSESESNNRPLTLARGIQFSATRYSFLSNSSWSTVPVMYASMRVQIILGPSAFPWDFYTLSACSNPDLANALLLNMFGQCRIGFWTIRGVEHRRIGVILQNLNTLVWKTISGREGECLWNTAVGCWSRCRLDN